MLNGSNFVRDDFKTTVPVPAGFYSKCNRQLGFEVAPYCTCTPNQKLACFVLFLKIINNFLKNDIGIVKFLKQILQGTQIWHWNFSRPNGFYVRDGFKPQPPVDRWFRPVPPGFYCCKQWQPPWTRRNRRSTGGWVLKPPLMDQNCQNIVLINNLRLLAYLNFNTLFLFLCSLDNLLSRCILRKGVYIFEIV